MKTISIADILQLNTQERISLVQDIWDSIASVPESIPLTEEQREELDRRLDEYHRAPQAASSWEAVKERIRNRK